MFSNFSILNLMHTRRLSTLSQIDFNLNILECVGITQESHLFLHLHIKIILRMYRYRKLWHVEVFPTKIKTQIIIISIATEYLFSYWTKSTRNLLQLSHFQVCLRPSISRVDVDRFHLHNNRE